MHPEAREELRIGLRLAVLEYPRSSDHILASQIADCPVESSMAYHSQMGSLAEACRDSRHKSGSLVAVQATGSSALTTC